MPQTKTRIVCTQLQISSWFFRNRKLEFKNGSQRTDFAGSLSNGVDDLENFTSEMEWSFLFPSVSPVFFQIGTVTYQHRLRFRRVRIVMSTATGQSRGARDRGRSAFELCESTVDVTQR